MRIEHQKIGSVTIFNRVAQDKFKGKEAKLQFPFFMHCLGLFDP